MIMDHWARSLLLGMAIISLQNCAHDANLDSAEAYLHSNHVSRQDFPHHLSIHVRQSVIAAGVAVSQRLVVQTQEVQDRGMQIVDVNAAADHLVTKLIGFPVAKTAADAAASQKCRKTFGLMFAAVLLQRGRPGK